VLLIAARGLPAMSFEMAPRPATGGPWLRDGSGEPDNFGAIAHAII
jgi:hypothetical protein